LGNTADPFFYEVISRWRLCRFCLHLHYLVGKLTCNALPEGIPPEIASGRFIPDRPRTWRSWRKRGRRERLKGKEGTDSLVPRGEPIKKTALKTWSARKHYGSVAKPAGALNFL
jgi:hypothetical protein